MSDLRYAFRVLVKSPGYSIAAILTLALGIGATTAIFSLVNAVLLRPLPYPNPKQLILLRERTSIFGSDPVSYPNFLDWRAAQRGFTDLALYRRASMNLSSRGKETAPERIEGAVMTFNLIQIVGLKPILGRDFTAAEDVVGGPKVAMIGEGLWRHRFGGSPSVIGQQLMVDTVPRAIVGVLPNKMGVVRSAQVFIPLGDLRADKDILERGNYPGFSSVGRLKPYVTLEKARADLDGIARDLERRYPNSNTGRRITARTLLEATVGDYRQNLGFLLVAVSGVLLIACANVANLELARALSRRKEIAVRAAMGASPWRLMRLVSIESAMLGLIGGAAGLIIATLSLGFIRALSPTHAARFQETRLDLTTLGVTATVAVVSGLLVGIWPAYRVSRLASLTGVLHDAGTRGGSDSASRQRARSVLVVTQVALAFVLLVGAGLTLKSFWRAQNAPIGFKPQRILTMTLALPTARYDSKEKVSDFYSRLVERLRNLPGVVGVAIGDNVPFGESVWESTFHITGSPPMLSGQDPSAEVNAISQDYFKLMSMPILRGRNFGPEDIMGHPRSVIVDDWLARRFFRQHDPIGQHLDDNQTLETEPPALTIIGVVPHVRTAAPGEEFDRLHLPQMYFCAAQLPDEQNSLLVRTSGADPTALASAVVRELQIIDPDQPVASISTMEQNIAESLASRRLTMTLLGSFAALALVLASVGLYGVMALIVTQRTREFGIRLALGAPRRDVFRLALGRGLLLVAVGFGLGCLGAIIAGRALTSLLYGVGSLDPASMLIAALALVFVALLACWFPARRATRVDPIVALRHE